MKSEAGTLALRPVFMLYDGAPVPQLAWCYADVTVGALVEVERCELLDRLPIRDLAAFLLSQSTVPPLDEVRFKRTRLEWFDIEGTFTVTEWSKRLPGLRFRLEFHEDTWTKPWSIRDVVFKVRGALPEEARLEVDFGRTTVTALVAGVEEQATAGELRSRWESFLTDLVQHVEATLAAQCQRDSLVATFEFHPAVATACEQYLLYFVEFLRDLGIEAQSSLKHEAGRALFSVTPTDGAEALERVHEALSIFLQLPGAPISNHDFETDPRVQQLAGNVHHLRSQLHLAKALVQMKDATISQLSATVGQQQLIINEHVLESSLTRLDSSDPADQKEEVVKGVIALKKLEKNGVEVNLGELYRRLRGWFGK